MGFVETEESIDGGVEFLGLGMIDEGLDQRRIDPTNTSITDELMSMYN